MTQEKAAEIIDFNASREAVGVDEAPSAGAFLASARNAAGLSLVIVSDATKVKVEHLEAIEASDASALPITAYAVGFVKVYARYLGLDEAAVAKRFKKDVGADQPLASAAVAQAPVEPSNSPHISEGARMVSVFGIIAILIFVFWIVLQITSGPGDDGAARVTSAPEQRVRLGSAPLPAPAPRQRAPEVVEEAEESTPPAPAVNAAAQEPSDVASQDTPFETVLSEPAAPESAAPVDTGVPDLTDGDLEAAAVDAPVQQSEQSEDISPSATLSDQPVISLTEPLPLITAPVAESLSELPIASPERRTEVVRQRPDPAIVPDPIIVNAQLSRSIAPQYPNRCARNAEDLERVTVIFDVTAQGRPANVRVADTSNACFNTAAVSTLKRWRFDPKTVDGAPRPDLAKQATLNFRR